MELLLIHNPKAGYGQVDASTLIQMLTEAGHNVTYQSSKVDDLATALEREWDLVVVAGGDGTVTRVARTAGSGRAPLAILPLGSANNVARTVGHYGPLENLIRSWDGASVEEVDLGVVVADWGTSRFAESFGVGLLAETIVATDRNGAAHTRSKYRNAADRLAAAMESLRKTLRKMEPFEMTLSFPDGKRVEHLLWAEVAMANVVGPQLSVFHQQDLADGQLSFALLPEGERDTFARSLEDRLEGRAPERTGLTIGRTSELTMTWTGAAAQLDGHLVPDGPQDGSSERFATATVIPRALRYLRLVTEPR